ncbi:hypothetical protein IWQ49_006378 [Labrenzia sp. EL_126]|nr:hypothetical protein [Labrenzia sp. EL_126]
MVEVTSKYKGPLGLPRGPVIQPGQTVEVEDWARIKKHHHVKKLLGLGILEASDDQDDPDQEPGTGSNGGGAYSVVDKGRGWHVVMKDGEEVTKSLRADDLAEFGGMSDEDKAAFVELHPVKQD